MIAKEPLFSRNVLERKEVGGMQAKSGFAGLRGKKGKFIFQYGVGEGTRFGRRARRTFLRRGHTHRWPGRKKEEGSSKGRWY